MFSKDAFTQPATESFVLLRLNYSSRIDVSDKQAKALEEANEIYGYPPLPTLLYADSKGRPLMASKNETTVAPWLKEISTAAKILSDLKKAQTQEGLEKSKALYEAVKSVDISTIRVHHAELIAMIKAGDPEDTLGFAKMVALDKAVTDFAENVDTLYEEGKLDQILSDAEGLLKKDGLNPSQKQTLLFIKANVFYENKDTAKALTTLNELISIDPKSDLASEAQAAKKELE